MNTGRAVSRSDACLRPIEGEQEVCLIWHQVPENCVPFATEAEAQAAGYRRAKKPAAKKASKKAKG